MRNYLIAQNFGRIFFKIFDLTLFHRVVSGNQLTFKSWINAKTSIPVVMAFQNSEFIPTSGNILKNSSDR